MPVEVASHTKRLANASAEFREALRHVHAKLPPRPGTRLLSGIDGFPVLDLETGFDKLAAQISQTVQWEACLQSCVEAGATVFFELGPGAALSAMMLTEDNKDVTARSLEEFQTLHGARSWLARHESASY